MSTLRSWTEIDLSAYERNLNNIKGILPEHLNIISVVKADAYGHGLPQIVERSIKSGIKIFAVANLQEAHEIRNIGHGWPVLLLGALLPGEELEIPNSDFIPTISSVDELRRLNQASLAKDCISNFHLKIDTGMGRLGIWYTEAAELINQLSTFKNVKMSGIYSHLSDVKASPDFTQLQKNRLESTIESLSIDPEVMLHIDNSSTLHDTNSFDNFKAIRIGLLQYGIKPYSAFNLDRALISPTLSFYTKVGIVKSLPKGTAISYGRSYTLEKDSRLAVLTAGYGDGIPIEYGKEGTILIKGIHCPILGRITMDQTIIDVSNIPDVQVGEKATLIGESDGATILIEDFCEKAKTIPWALLCSITKRVKRLYINPRT